jgi:hypothetical protein
MSTLTSLTGDYDVVLNPSIYNENESDLLTVHFDSSSTTAKPDPNQTYKLVNHGQRLEAGPNSFQCEPDNNTNENMFMLIFDESQNKFELRHVSHSVNVGKAIPSGVVANSYNGGNGGGVATPSTVAVSAIEDSEEDDDDDDDELLGELANELEGSLDSDSDSDSGANGSGMIQIVESSKPNSSIRTNRSTGNGIDNSNGGNRAQGGPISLRGFLSGQQRRENEEDLSSSEEE